MRVWGDGEGEEGKEENLDYEIRTGRSIVV